LLAPAAKTDKSLSSANQNPEKLYGSKLVAVTISYADSVATFTPQTPLTSNTTYTCRLTRGVKDMMGNAIQADYVFTFSTGSTVSPSVVSTNPENEATGVVRDHRISVIFSVPMNPESITSGTFLLKQGTTAIEGTITYAGTTALFVPTTSLAANTLYSATITSSVKDTHGTDMGADYNWTFTTSDAFSPSILSTSPVDLETNVVLNKTITATFSEPMNPLTFTVTSFTVRQGTTQIVGVVSYIGFTAYFNPTNNLLPGLVYTAKINRETKNLVGIPMLNDYEWTFTTGTFSVPTVTSTSPGNNETNVVLTRIITATFSEAMDPLSINAETFMLKHGLVEVNGAISYTGNTATFVPSSNLLSGTTYTVTITNVVENLSGTHLVSNYTWNFTTVATLGPLVVDLRSVARFGIIAGVGVSNNAGFSEIRNLDVGICPGVRSSITGFPPAIMVNGAIYAFDDAAPIPAMLTQAKLDLVEAYLFAEAAVTPAPQTVEGDQGGKTLAPGIYKSTSTLLIQSGNLTLDAQGDVNAVWIFQIASDFTTVGGAGGNVILSGGAQAKNIFWQTGSSATIGDGTSFKGNVLALTSITMNTNATAEGRMLAQNGSVVMTSTNIINKP
jgi:methionine-rich copper-binding protein CopC